VDKKLWKQKYPAILYASAQEPWEWPGVFFPFQEEMAMPKFFVHLDHLDSRATDLTGSNFNNLSDAVDEARETIREVAADQIRENQVLTLVSACICDPEGRILAEVRSAEILKDLIPEGVALPSGSEH
jgi:hypothetical protein